MPEHRHRIDMLNSIPVIGHIKGTFHRKFGNDEAAVKAFTEANRTIVVLAAGAAGFYMHGIPLAILLGSTAGAEWDLWTIIRTNGRRIQGICQIIDDPSNFNAWIDATFDLANDGFTGAYGGRMARAGSAALGVVVAPTKNGGTAAKAGKEAVAEECASKSGCESLAQVLPSELLKESVSSSI